jgi:hypothetical protein
LFSIAISAMPLMAIADDELDTVLNSFKNAISSKMYTYYSNMQSTDPDSLEFNEFIRKKAKILATCVGDQFATSLAEWQKHELLMGFRGRRNDELPWMNEEIFNAEKKCFDLVLARGMH